MPEKKSKGGKREGAGRKKVERPTNANVAAKVLAQTRAEQLWVTLIELECNRLGIGKDAKLLPVPKKVEPGKDVISGPDYQGRFSIIPLTNVLRYLEDRAYGRPMENSTINHLHDKPLDLNVTISLAETIEKARKRVKA